MFGDFWTHYKEGSLIYFLVHFIITEKWICIFCNAAILRTYYIFRFNL